MGVCQLRSYLRIFFFRRSGGDVQRHDPDSGPWISCGVWKHCTRPSAVLQLKQGARYHETNMFCYGVGFFNLSQDSFCLSSLLGFWVFGRLDPKPKRFCWQIFFTWVLFCRYGDNVGRNNRLVFFWQVSLIFPIMMGWPLMQLYNQGYILCAHILTHPRVCQKMLKGTILLV